MKEVDKRKLVLLTCAYGRSCVFDVFVMGVHRLKDVLRNSCEITVVVVGSDEEWLKKKCKKHQFAYTDSCNKPLGMKWNNGLAFCQQLEFEHLLIMGSDDLISANVVTKYLNQGDKQGGYQGLLDMYIYDVVSRRLVYWPGYTGVRAGQSIGLGRFLTRNILDAMDWSLWAPNLDRGLDRSMSQKLSRLGVEEHSYSILNINAIALDIKTATNVSKFEDFDGIDMPLRTLGNGLLSEEELRAICQLR